MLYSENKERENRFILSLKIAIPFLSIIIFILIIVITDINIKELLKNNIIAFLIITFIYIYYILYQIYMAFETSLIDNITKTFSRDYILKIIDKEKKYDNFLVILLKITNIEDINDRYGLKKTDKILYEFANKIDNFFVKQGFKNIKIGHIVGGSFIFTLKANEKRANHLIRQFINRIENEQIDNIFLKIIYSIVESDSENSSKELLISLQEKLKCDVNERRNSRRLSIKVNEFENLIMSLIEEKKFDFRYQPILNINLKEIDIYELLVKLNSKEYGKISQNQFISVVNRIGYELKFDIILVEEIFKIVSKYKDKKISINISSYSIRNSEFLHKVEKLLTQYNIQKEQIIFEISANSSLNDVIKLGENINILRDLGILIAIDNFGVDNTSFKYIKNINFDMVKFDIEYSKKYKDKKYMQILKAFISIFKDLDVKTVIKFVEDEKSYNFFKDLGIDYIQGFIVGKPVKEIVK